MNNPYKPPSTKVDISYQYGGNSARSITAIKLLACAALIFTFDLNSIGLISSYDVFKISFRAWFLHAAQLTLVIAGIAVTIDILLIHLDF